MFNDEQRWPRGSLSFIKMFTAVQFVDAQNVPRSATSLIIIDLCLSLLFFT